jgi:hypothetical protein
MYKLVGQSVCDETCVGWGEGVGSLETVTEETLVMRRTSYWHMSATERHYLGVTNILQGGAYIMSDCELASPSARKLVIEKQKWPKVFL